MDKCLQNSSKEELITQVTSTALSLLWNLQHEAERAFEPFGLSPIKALVLNIIAGSSLYPKQLSEKLATAPPATSLLINDLESRGLIKRRLDEEDRRRFILDLTPEGQIMLERIHQAWYQTTQPYLDYLSKDELISIRKIQLKLLESL